MVKLLYSNQKENAYFFNTIEMENNHAETKTGIFTELLNDETFEHTIESDDSKSEENEDKNLEERMLYEGSNTNLTDLAVALLSLKYKHKLLESALNDILNLIKILTFYSFYFHHLIFVLKL